MSAKAPLVTGPYYTFSCPYGTFVSCERDEWYVSRKRTPAEQRTKARAWMRQLRLGPEQRASVLRCCAETCLGRIVRSRRQRRRYVIDQLFPTVCFPTLAKAVHYLVANEGRLVFCT